MINERSAKTAGILTVLAAVFAALASTRGASALEISLEENRADRGNIGYVDIRRIFNAFPETRRAKQSYREVVRQAEEQISLRKAELITLRQEIFNLKMERDLLKRTPILTAPETRAGSAPPEHGPRTEPEMRPSTTTAAEDLLEPGEKEELKDAVADDSSLDTLPGMSRSLEEGSAEPEEAPVEPPSAAKTEEEPAAEAAETPTTEPKPVEPLIINIPGVTEEPILVEPPSTTPPTEPPPEPAAAVPPPELQPDGEDAAEPETAETPAEASAPAAQTTVPAAAEMKTADAEPPVAVPPAQPPRDTLDSIARERQLAELDEKIREKEAEYRKKSDEFKEYQARVETDLISIESRRSEILLGRIYNAVREVARTAGVSVVVDKNQILFGQPSVDLTDKVIKKLEEQSL